MFGERRIGDVRGAVNLVLRLMWGMAGRGGVFGRRTEVKQYWWLLKKHP